MNEYKITHTPKVGPVNKPSDGMNPKHDRGLCAVSDAQLPQLLNNPHNQMKIPVVTATI